MVGKWWVCSVFFLNKQRKYSVNYSFVTTELRKLEEHVSGPSEEGMPAGTAQAPEQGSGRPRCRATASASRSTANGKDGINTDQEAQQATQHELEQLTADLPTGNQNPPCRSAVPSCVCGEAPSQCLDRVGWGTEPRAYFSPSNGLQTTRKEVFCRGGELVAASSSPSKPQCAFQGWQSCSHSNIAN